MSYEAISHPKEDVSGSGNPHPLSCKIRKPRKCTEEHITYIYTFRTSHTDLHMLITMPLLVFPILSKRAHCALNYILSQIMCMIGSSDV